MTGASAARPNPIVPLVVRSALLAAGLLPFLPGALSGVHVLGAIGRLVEAWFEFQCHRDADRSLVLIGTILPVCSRCTGIYLGLGLGALVVRPRLGVWPLRIWVGFAAFVMILDVLTEMLGMRPPSTWLRLLTGIALSYPVAVAAMLAARGEESEP